MQSDIRHNWQIDEILDLFNLPFSDLIYKAQNTHRQHHDPNKIQVSTLLSIKTGGCPEDCKYCPQSSHYHTGLQADKLMDKNAITEEAEKAKQAGASRFCMGAAWRSPKERDMPKIIDIIKSVRNMGMETCMTLGMLSESQAQQLKEAGLDYYNHNIDTSPEYYKDIITTRTIEDRFETLENVRKSGISVCCGGIVGMGENQKHRAEMLQTLANMAEHPESVPINLLVQIKGTPMADLQKPDNLDFVRTVAIARILMPKSAVRLSAGREDMSDEMQALCFLTGANSIFYGEKLLTTPNPNENEDMELFARLGIEAA